MKYIIPRTAHTKSQIQRLIRRINITNRQLRSPHEQSDCQIYHELVRPSLKNWFSDGGILKLSCKLTHRRHIFPLSKKTRTFWSQSYRTFSGRIWYSVQFRFAEVLSSAASSILLAPHLAKRRIMDVASLDCFIVFSSWTTCLCFMSLDYSQFIRISLALVIASARSKFNVK